MNVELEFKKIYRKYLKEFISDDENIYKYETIFILAILFMTGFITITDVVILNINYRYNRLKFDLVPETKRFIQLVQKDTKMQNRLKRLYEVEKLNLNENEIQSFYDRFAKKVLVPFSNVKHLNINPRCLIANRDNPYFWTADRMCDVRILELFINCAGYDIDPMHERFNTIHVHEKLYYKYVKILINCGVLKDFTDKQLEQLLQYCPRNTNEYNMIYALTGHY
jgi:hypothetical protein